MALPGFIFGGDTGIKSPEDLARARAIAEALLMPQRPAQNVGEGLAVLGQAIRGRREMNAANRAQATGDASASSAIAQALGGGLFPAAPGGGPAPSGSGDQLAWTDAKPYQKALLNTIAGPESGGRYDVIYGGGKFNDFSHHPNQAVHIQTGPNAGRTSSAAGKYQFLGSTWDQQAKELGLQDFSPVNQDKAAWNLAAETYKAKTGQDLDSALQSGDPNTIAQVGKVLNPVWTSLPGGIEQGTNRDKFVATYQKALGAGATPAQAQQAAQQAAPVQVASNDPSAGVAQALAGPGGRATQAPASPVAAALQLPQQGPIPQGRPDVVAALNGTPAPQPGAVGGPAATTPAGQRVLSQMMSPLPMGGNAMQMQPPAGAQPAPPLPTREIAPDPMGAAPAPQAQPDNLPVMAGGSADAIAPGQGGPSIQQLMQAAQNPWLKPEQRALVNGLLAQKMKQNDPATLLEMEKNRLEMEKTRIETERLRNPQMTPAEKARLDLDQQKFEADKNKLMELSPGTTVFDPAKREPVYSAPKEVAKPAGVQEYEYAKAQGFPGTYADWEASKKGGMSLQVDPTTGEVTFQQGGNIKPMTEAQSKDTTFATRAAGALPLLDKYGDALTSFSETAGGQVPMVGNYMKSPEFQQAEQAGKEFLQAILRKDTGAAITAGETAEYGSVYLPRPGDSPELLAQKKASRTRALEAMKAGMTPQAILAQEKALANSGAPAAPAAQPAKKPAVIDGYTIEEVQ